MGGRGGMEVWEEGEMLFCRPFYKRLYATANSTKGANSQSKDVT